MYLLILLSKHRKSQFLIFPKTESNLSGCFWIKDKLLLITSATISCATCARSCPSIPEVGLFSPSIFMQYLIRRNLWDSTSCINRSSWLISVSFLITYSFVLLNSSVRINILKLRSRLGREQPAQHLPKSGNAGHE